MGINKKVAWFTEGGWKGQVPRNYPGMRNDAAWMCLFNATHYPIWDVTHVQEKYDLGIVTLPKKHIDKLMQIDLINELRKVCNKIAYMQEGPNWYWQDYTIEEQCWFFNTLNEFDILYAHNESDKRYYEGLTNVECRLMPTVMIEDLLVNLPKAERKNTMIGGNFCSWYGGFDSYIIAQEFNTPIHIPSMGRKIANEEMLPNLHHLPYTSWAEWIYTLNNFKYGIHLMRTHAAGTFALNCAYLGIPCIGYEGLDTQEMCHPNLTVKLGDLNSAKQLAIKLKEDSEFYNLCATECQENYKTLFTEQVFMSKNLID